MTIREASSCTMRKELLLCESEFKTATTQCVCCADKRPLKSDSEDDPKNHTLTETVVPIVRQAEAIIARAPVISWDVDALVDTAAVVLSRTLVHVYREKTEKRILEPVLGVWNRF